MSPFIKQLISLALILASLTFFQAAVLAQTPSNQTQLKPAIMILGTYHMNNPGRDVVNTQADDVLQPKRQREIEELVSLLKKFNPTKIAVELEPSEDLVFQPNYQKYLNGEYQLKNNEVEQIGFRLAKELKHNKIYAVDWNGDAPGDAVNYDYFAFAKKNNQSELLENWIRKGQALAKPEQELQKNGTVLDILRYMNKEETIEKWHSGYYDLLNFAAGEQNIGANWLQSWYGRNLKIFANLTRITESPTDRILVVYGAGHLKLLKQFTEESGRYQVEDVFTYLNSKASSKR